MATISYTGQLVVTSCWCGIVVAIPSDLHDYAVRKGTEVFCPLGHRFVYGDGENARLKREIEQERQRAVRLRAEIDQKRAEIEHQRRRIAATKGALTKTKKRIGNGVCPCCNRHFANVERHMKTKHPEVAE